jgi:hypothetical protein
MRTTKRYTNVTFTKRVDYEGGTHRPPKAVSGPKICRTCGAVYVRRRWLPKTDPRAEALGAGAVETICRACSMQARGQAGGFLTISGAFFVAHKTDIERLLHNEELRAVETNPLGRIIGWDRSAPDRLVLTTSTEHLVERLGHALNRAYGGVIEYGFSHGNKFARGTWHRD